MGGPFGEVRPGEFGRVDRGDYVSTDLNTVKEDRQSEPELRVLDCPYCGYCLNTRPVETVCSECGGTVHRDWHLFGGMSRWSGLGLARRILTAAVFGLPLIGGAYHAFSRDRMWGLPFIGLLGCLFAHVIFSKPPHRVAVNRLGIHVVCPRSRTHESLPWETILSVDRTIHGASIQRRGLPPLSPDAWRGDVEECQRFLDFLDDAYPACRNSIS